MMNPPLTADECALIRCLSHTHLSLLIVEIEAHGWWKARDLLADFWGRKDYSGCMKCVQRSQGWPGHNPKNRKEPTEYD